MAKNIALIGLGPHAKRIHLHYFKKYNIYPRMIIDLQSQEDEIRKICNDFGFVDTDIVLVSDKFKDDESLNRELNAVLIEAFHRNKITHAFISTEPKAHNMYLEFCLKNDIHVLSDKPITAFKDANAEENISKVKKQYEHLLKLRNESSANCHILCQRQFHHGYIHIKKLLEEVITKYNIPITSIELTHCDGKWILPHEMDVENHPFKYGYGKLFHSGYHFVQLLSDLIKLNDLVTEDKHITHMNVFSHALTPNDELAVITPEDLKKLFKINKLPEFYNNKRKFDNYGEKNFNSLISFTNGKGNVITMASLNMQQLGFSRREKMMASKDMYKDNGRVRHEYVNIEVGPLMNIKIHSYQSKEIKDRKKKIESLPGELDHFDIEVFRNAGLIGGKPYERIKLKNLYKETDKDKFLGYNEYAREEAITDFLKSASKKGDLREQGLAIEIFNTVHTSLSNSNRGINKEEKVKVKGLI